MTAFKKSYIISFLLLTLSLFLFFNSNTQNFFNRNIKNMGRTVLAKIETSKLNNQIKLSILKIKQNNKVFLEVYGQLNHGLELIDTLKLEGEYDAYILIKDQTSNLAIANVDRDVDLEIIAPTYNRRMKPILNVYKYDSRLEEFRKVNTKFTKPIL